MATAARTGPPALATPTSPAVVAVPVFSSAGPGLSRPDAAVPRTPRRFMSFHCVLAPMILFRQHLDIMPIYLYYIAWSGLSSAGDAVWRGTCMAVTLKPQE